MRAFYDALIAIVEEIQPCTVHQAFYQAEVRGLVEKTEQAYDRVQEALAKLRREKLVPWDHVVDGPRQILCPGSLHDEMVPFRPGWRAGPMSTTRTPSPYVLGSADSEHDRLMRQAKRLGPFTERLFRDAGIGPGQRILDTGSGVGDVALLAGRLVGPTGAVVGVDRDGTALAGARARAAEARLAHVRFIEADVSDVTGEAPFDAVIGRFILMFQPDPVAALRTLAAHLRPGGVLVFQEASWPSFLSQTAHLPLWSACAALIMESLRRAGVRNDMGLVLFRGFQDIGFPVPAMRLDVPIDQGADTRRWLYDLICTLRPRFGELGLSHDSVGDVDTLAERLERELDDTRSYAAGVGLVGAWSRKPGG